MGYVYYQPKQQPSQQQQQKQSHKVQEVRRSPLGSIATWCIDKATGTWLEGWARFFVGESLVGRFASVIAVSIVLGVIIDLAIVSVPILASPASAIGFAATAPAVLGALAGAGAGGLGGAIVGALWGWLVGKIVEPVANEAVSNQLENVLVPIAAWIVATLSGLLAGKVVVRGFEKIESKSAGVARVIGMLFLLVAFGAIGFVIYGIVISLARR